MILNPATDFPERRFAVGAVLAGGTPYGDGPLAEGYFVAPTVVELSKPADIWSEELFGPVLAVRRAGNGASYVPYRAGVIPWHAAMAATYCHMTAPLRRLADRYVIRAALAVANGLAVPPSAEAAFQQLGPVMDRADQRSGQVERAVVDLAEAAILADREGETFEAVVTDHGDGGTRFQLCELPVVARTKAHHVRPGDRIHVRLESADPARREVRFARQA